MADCTPSGGECGGGAQCNSFGMCVALEDAGPMADAFALVPDALVLRPDAGADAGLDAAEAPVEVCTPSVAGAVVDDEDADGSIDEGCEWSFGTPHAVLDLSTSAAGARIAMVTPDGLRAYVSGAHPAADGSGSAMGGLFVASRPSPTARFGALSPVGIGSGGSLAIGTVSLSDDELTLYFDDDDTTSRSRLYRAVRSRTDEPFGPPEELAALNVAGVRTYTPVPSHDHLELFFSREMPPARELWVARRASTAEDFAAPERLTIPVDTVENARPDLDGRGLFFTQFSGVEWRILYARRAARGATTFEAPVELTSLAGPGYGTVYALSQGTREIWLSSSRPWAAGSFAIFRAEICRDGACAERRVDCPTGTRSPDGQHCYFAAGAPTGFAEAHLRCAAAGGHLATTHSEAERALVWGFRSPSTDGVWVGGYDGEGPGGSTGLPSVPECRRAGLDAALACRFRWVTDEPFFFAPWGTTMGRRMDPQDPGNEDCLVLFGPVFDRAGDMADIACGAALDVVCEREQWPTW